MAVLALSVVGAGISSAMGFGASAGWLVGSLIGNLLFQKKGPNTEGPRLTDLTVQSSTEGAPIPIVFGRMRIAGNMIWSGGIQEVKTKKKQGGKGMGGSSTHTTYTYNASFAIGLCEGPIQGVRRIWADGKLIYSSANNATAATLYASRKKMANITIYLGSETQTADPIVAAAVGSANCPGFRGLAYVVFERLQLADFGNRIPNLTFEVVTGTEGDYLWRVNTWPDVNLVNTIQVEVNNGIISTGSSERISGSDWHTRTRKIDLAGNLISETWGPIKTTAGGSSASITRIRNRIRLARLGIAGIGVVDGVHRWLYDLNITAPVVSLRPWGDSPGVFATDGAAAHVYYNGYYYTTSERLDKIPPSRSVNGFVRFPVSNGVAIADHPDKLIDVYALGLAQEATSTSVNIVSFSITDRGTLLLGVREDHIITYRYLEFDADCNFIKGYTFSGIEVPPPACIAIVWGKYWAVPFNSGGADNRIRLWHESSPGVMSLVKTVSTGNPQVWIHDLGNGLFATRNGVFSIPPPVTPPALTVGYIIDQICERCGIDSGKRFTSQLTQSIDGYMIPQPMTGRAAIEPLQQAYFFDAVESDYTAKFIKRPGTIVATLESGDLGAGIDRAATDDFKRRHMQELELPVEIRVSYLDINNDYLPGMQSARRLTTPSRHTVELQLPIAMSSSLAAQIADITLRNVWAERDTYEFYLMREFAQLDPADLVNMPDGNTVRIAAVEFTDPGLVKVVALRDISGGYTSNAVGNSTSHEYPQEVAIIGPTEIEFLDIPPLRDSDALTPGFYIATYGLLSGWGGAEIVRSIDDGSTFTNLEIMTSEATIGVTSTALGNPQFTDTFDLSAGVVVVIKTPGATLSSVSDEVLLAGANAMLIGSEVIQFGVATLTATSTYRLTRLLRGRLGTQQHVGTHVAGERCVLLDSDIRFIPDGESNINVTMGYLATTFGLTQDESILEEFTNTANVMRNPPPVFTGSDLNSSGQWTFTWNPRTRSGWWFLGSGFDHSAVDAIEQYQVQVYDTLGNLKSTRTVTDSEFDYTRTMQIEDFGYPVLAFEIRVAAISNLNVIGHQASAAPRTVQRGRYVNAHLYMRPVLYWRRIIDSTPDDYSPNNYDGTSSGLVDSDPDVPVVNESSGTSSVASASLTVGYMQRTRSNSPLLNIVKPFSLYIWVKYSHTNTQRTLMGCWDSAVTTSQSWRLGAGTTAGTLRFQVTIGGVIRVAAHSGGYNDNNWHQVVGVYEVDGTVKLYVDGVLKASASGTYGDSQLGTANFRVGQNSDGTEQFVGKFFGVAVHERPMTPQIILDLYNTAKGIA